MGLARDSAQLELLLLGTLASVTLATYIRMSVFPVVLPAIYYQTVFASLVPTLAHPASELPQLVFPALLVSITIQQLEHVMPSPTATTVKWNFKESAPGFVLPTGISTKLPASVLVPAATSKTALAAASSPLPPTSVHSLSSCKATPVWLSASLDSTPTQRLAPAWPAHPLARLAFPLITV